MSGKGGNSAEAAPGATEAAAGDDGIRRGILPGLLAVNLRRAQLASFRHFETWFEADDMTPLQFGTLNLIDLNPGLTQKFMAAHVKVERASFGESLARLERKGLIERRTDPNDGRAKIMSLTPEGKRVLERLRAEVRAQEREFAGALSDLEMQQLLQLLGKLQRGD